MYSKEMIFKQLKAMNAPQDRIVLMHTSLKAVGEVEGRGEGLLEILIEYFTEKGGLFCVPTHTWANMGHPDRITLDMNGEGVCIGAFPTLAAKHPAAHRSLHTTHSMAVFGDAKRAEAFIAGEEACITPTPPEGCYGKIYDADGYVLLVGVGHDKNTFLHCVDEMLDVPNRLSVDRRPAVVRHRSGELEKRWIHVHAWGISRRFPKYEPAFRHHGCLQDGYIGDAKTQLCSTRKMKEVMELIRVRSNGIELMTSDEPLQPEWYL